jgi:nitrate/nitrite-specific signal transduction histidine kinase
VLLVVFLTVRIVVLKPLAHLTHAALAIRNGQLDATI